MTAPAWWGPRPFPKHHGDHVKFDELAEDFLTDYRINQRKSLERAEISTRHLKEKFEGMRIADITTATVKTYIEERMGSGAAHATINRELAALKRMLKLGAQSTPPKVDRVPHIPMLKERNAREGFFERADFLALRDALPSYLKGVVTFGFKTGWRKSEILCLQWAQVDLDNGIVRLDPGDTKNDNPRMVYLDEELKEVFQTQWIARKETGKLSAYVFPNEAGMDRIRDFRKSWDTACTEAGISGKLFHDLRRTAVRNMVRSGISERIAMKISGHKTRSVFDRYDVTSGEDLKKAASRQEAYLQEQDSVLGTKMGTILKIRKKRGANQNG
ncbi:phage integrase family protein [Syntrophobacter fumaroxidans MPOB]|uniref:Phage integrase family protein n=1 Tax=Syntrophobacter fumaroxidans (strain DSM 10017 / MPOB) TaxID=335543 RepID=A0LHA2_SYNFM|nr:phage integrase family protein [Syntrophobacter fumaroxidans MPOB]